MRKLLVTSFVCLLAILWAGPAEAQTAGLKFGRVFSELDGETGDPGSTFGRRSDWAAGVFLRFGFGAISIQPEALYTKRGAKLEGADVLGEPTIEMTYVEVPILLRIGSGSTALYGGGYGALKVDAKVTEDGTETDISSDVEDIDYGIVFGVGLGFGSIEIDGRFTMGLANLVKDAGAPELKHRAISVLAAINF